MELLFVWPNIKSTFSNLVIKRIHPMKKTSYLLLPIAAFALTATSAAAFNPELLERAGLTEEQIAAFEVAQELKRDGDRQGARDVLAEAGIDLDVLEEMRNVMRHEHQRHHDEVESAIESGDFEAFRIAVVDTPLGNKVTTPEQFQTLMEAHVLRQVGEHEEAVQLLKTLGLNPGKRFHSPRQWQSHES